MILRSKKTYTTVAVAAALSFANVTTANAASVSITNAGFESSFDGWEDTDPSAISSSDSHEGTYAAKVTGSAGKFEQDVSVNANTDYTLTAYIMGSGEIGAIVNGSSTSQTGGGSDFEQVSVTFNSGSATTVTIYGAYSGDEGRFDTFALESSGTVTPTPTPSGSTSVPGLIEAEDYVGFADTTSGNTAGQYRSDDVDIQVTSDTGGGYNVGWIKAGEYLEYPISVSSAGEYTANIRVASSKTTGSFSVLVDGSAQDSVDVGSTGGWQSWETRTVDLGTLSAGEHTIRIDVTGNDFNFNWIDVEAVTPTPTPSESTSVPALIQAEDYVGFYDNSSGNTGGQYRSDDVDIETTGDTDGGYNVGWVKAGEYLEYPISVSSAGDYTADIRVASSTTTGAFDVLVDGSNQDSIAVGSTGGWQSWETRTVDLGSLSAGDHTIRLDVTGSDFNINWIDVKKEAGNNEPGEFDWSGWKTTLPVNGDTWYDNGNTSSAAEIQPEGCTDDVFDENLDIEYFWSDSEGLHFKVPMNLDGKTPNTSYIRSELRELHDWTPCGTTSEANWAYGGDHTLSATVRIDDYNTDGPKVVVGQIHGHDISYATIKLHWEGDSKPIRVIYNETPNSSTPENVYLGYVDSSDFWSYTIKMTDTGIELSAGGVTETITFGNELSNDWKDADFYFKAGLYPQEKPSSSSTDVYEATFSEVTVSH